MAAGVPSPPRMYRPLHVDAAGSGRPVVVLHGVGFGPWSVAPVAGALSPVARTLVVHRAGYGGSHAVAVANSMDELVDDLLRTMNRCDVDRAVVAGFAGGATVALAAAIRCPERFLGLVLHEPALGPRASGVHGLLQGLADRVRPLAPTDALAAVVAAMLGPDARPQLPDQALTDAHAIPLEVPVFARFAPTGDDLDALRSLSLITTVGSDSPPARREAADVLARGAGARVVVVPNSAHLVQVDAPQAFAAEVAGIIT